MTFQALVFDMDGVLVDSEPLHLEVEQAIFEELGLEVSEEEHFSYVGMAPQEVWTHIRRRHGLDAQAEALLQKEQDRKYALFQQREIPLVPGVLPLLKELRQKGCPLALASSSPRRIIDLFARKTDIRGFFDLTLSAEEVSRGKPAPDIFLAAAARLGLPARDCLVIEDSANGVKAAKAAGMYCLGFQNLNSGYQDLTEADRVVEKFSPEVRGLIQQWTAPC